jgi:hypothetical protein
MGKSWAGIHVRVLKALKRSLQKSPHSCVTRLIAQSFSVRGTVVRHRKKSGNVVGGRHVCDLAYNFVSS